MSLPSRRPAVPAALERLVRPLTLAGERTLPVDDALGGLLPGGLPRGVTVTTTGDAPRSCAFALVGAASRAGSWLAILGLGDLGWRAVAELGVDPARIVAVTSTDTGRDADCVSAALDGFDLVVVGPSMRLGTAEERRLAARARERGAVLIGVHESVPGRPTSRGSSSVGPFPDQADLRVTTSAAPWDGLGTGVGRLTGRAVTVTIEGRRVPGRRRTDRLLLPGNTGKAMTIVPATAPHGDQTAASPPRPVSILPRRSA